MKFRIARALIFVFVVLGVGSADAQTGRRWGDILPELNKKDIELAQSKARVELTGKPIGTVLEWQNPKSGNSGTVQLVSIFEWENHPCRKVVHAIHMSKQSKQRANQNWEITICEIEGEWKWPVPPKRL